MRKGNLTPKTITAPLAAFTMACLLFAYTRSSIRSARDQARYGQGHGQHQGHINSGGGRPTPPDSNSSA
ncbi:hypothetical protein CkaCkLH20_01807 [Colletotrichum karsti]|uniref:Uncharacterized protein n=1 Tax=Colletotrichum karsti TaxID=1095194 RepID=A0A9P6IJ14_9PEZI|nr:uncharacterized protein CkaCkLH20_01807 [Colletotrichum karsti]KAF9880765.1 hypothetical protein CkaCkLH20_01807 [Colletotrichum karsti]